MQALNDLVTVLREDIQILRQEINDSIEESLLRITCKPGDRVDVLKTLLAQQSDVIDMIRAKQKVLAALTDS